MNWQIYRLDAVFGLETIKEFLPRYYNILNGNKIPLFQLAKRYEVDFNENESLEELMKIHNEEIKDFFKNLENIGNKGAEKSLLDLKILIAEKIVESCEFCEIKCKVNRKERAGYCGVSYYPRISSMFMHLGEESWITPSFTIFFAGCNFRCVFCQNFDISQNSKNGIYIKEEIVAKEIDLAFLEGNRNVNFVGGEPTPNLHYILKVLKHVNSNIPVVWNSNAYESEIAINLLAGIVDVYLYDIKYGNNECAKRLSKVRNYFEIATRNIKFANNFSELSLRHLVLPNHIECCSLKIIDWIKDNLKEKYVLNIMNQYRPEYKAKEYPEINRRILEEEYEKVLRYAKEKGIIFFEQ
ncbi:MAG: radical SAM protein [Candidatus Aenigmatarchaeota archaeon]